MNKLIFFFCFVTTAYVQAQTSVEGTVLDGHSMEPVVGATVHIPKLEKGTITDLNGTFLLDNLPTGKHTLVVSFLNYSTRTLDITLPLETPLNVTLFPSAIEMEEVIISTPFHQLQSENVMKVERATMEELSRTGAINLSEGITQIAGVESLTTGSGIGKPVIRGLSSNRVLVYTQGVRLENQQFGDEHGLGINDSGVESVEVIKGPASLLYGSDALGGVLYLNPERYAPQDSLQMDASTMYFSNTQGIQYNAGMKSSGEKFKFLVRGNYELHSDYETGNGERVTNTRNNEWDLKTGVGYRTKYYKGDLRYNLNHSNTGIPEELGEQSTSKEILEPYQEIQNHILSLDNTFYLGSSSLDLKLGYLFNNRMEYEDHEAHEEEPQEEEGIEPHGEEAALQMHLETLNYDVKYHFPITGKFETILGLQGMFQTNKNLGEEVLIPDASTTDIGLLATTHYHLEKIDFQAGIRFDRREIDGESMGTAGTEEFIPAINRDFNSFNGALGMKFDLAPAISSRINLSTGFRAPNLSELSSNGSHHGSNRYEVGNQDLKNEQNYQLDLALEFRNDHFEIFANAFFNNITDYIYLTPTGEVMEDNPVFNYVQNDAKLYGGETGIHIHPHPWDWLHLESSFELVEGKLREGYLPLIPAPSVLNTLRLETGNLKPWLQNTFSFVSIKTTFEKTRVESFETQNKGYSLLNAGIGGSFVLKKAEIQLQLSGKNLLDKSYISHLSRLKPDGILNMGRNVSFSLKLLL